MARGADAPDFNASDFLVLARVTTIIADGIRASLRHDAGRRAASVGPGLVVLGATDAVELITPPARPLLGALRSATPPESDQTPPAAQLALAAFARARDRRADRAGQRAQRAGMDLHARLAAGGAKHGRVAIVLDMATGPRVAALRLEAHGVTPRERQIAAVLAQGRSNADIATTPVLSPYTVQDHIKSLFEKTGVSSRRELVARIFLEDHLPQWAIPTACAWRS